MSTKLLKHFVCCYVWFYKYNIAFDPFYHSPTGVRMYILPDPSPAQRDLVFLSADVPTVVTLPSQANAHTSFFVSALWKIIIESVEPEMKYSPLLVNVTEVTVALCVLMTARVTALRAFHTRTLLSSLPLTTKLQSGEKQTAVTPLLCPQNVATLEYVRASHNLIVLSELPVAMRRPSLLVAQDSTASVVRDVSKAEGKQIGRPGE